MHTTNFDLPASASKKVTLPHISMLSGPKPQVTTPTRDAVSAAASHAALILVGLDEQGRAHASWFDADQTDAAAVAADLMSMAIIDITTEDLAAIASKLPKGKLFESGKAFVPFVKRTVYDQLATHLGDDYLTSATARVESAQAAAAESYAKASKGEAPLRKPEDWSKLLAGDLVLASEDPEEGWFEAVVVEATGDDKLRLRWRDFADLPTFTRRITEIALLHPQSAAR